MFRAIMSELGVTYPISRHLWYAIRSVVIGTAVVALMINTPAARQHQALSMLALLFLLNLPAIVTAIESRSECGELGARFALAGIFLGQGIFALAHFSTASVACSVLCGAAAYYVLKDTRSKLYNYDSGLFDEPATSMKIIHAIIGIHAIAILALISVLWSNIRQP